MAWSNTNDAYKPHHSDYLNATDTPKRPMALASIFVTLLLFTGAILALFFGGRWVYDTFIAVDSEPTTSETSTDENTADEQTSSSDNTSNQSDNGSQGSATDDGATSSSDSSSSTAPNDSTATSPPDNTTSASAPSTGEQEVANTVPNTGPESLIGVFVLATVLGSAIHSYATRRA